MPAGPVGQTAAEATAESGRPRRQLLLPQDIERRQRRGASQRVGHEGGCVKRLSRSVPTAHDPAGTDHRGDRQAAPQRLTTAEQIGADAVGADREPATGAAKTGKDLVDDQQHAPTAAKRRHLSEPTGRGEQNPLAPDQRLENDGAQPLLPLEQGADTMRCAAER